MFFFFQQHVIFLFQTVCLSQYYLPVGLIQHILSTSGAVLQKGLVAITPPVMSQQWILGLVMLRLVFLGVSLDVQTWSLKQEVCDNRYSTCLVPKSST